MWIHANKKAAVHENFRLIVIAEKEAVYDTKRFPIPLINRLEKHFLTAANMLDKEQLAMRDTLDTWVKTFVSATTEFGRAKPYETLIGFHGDTTSSLILYLSEQMTRINLNNSKNLPDDSMDFCSHVSEIDSDENVILLEAKMTLIKCATPDSVIRASSSKSLDKKGWKII